DLVDAERAAFVAFTRLSRQFGDTSLAGDVVRLDFVERRLVERPRGVVCRRGARRGGTAPLPGPVQELDVVGDDLRLAPALAFVLVLANLEPSLNAHQAALGQVVGAHLGQAPPGDDV